jgi:uncharacterized membrane protein
VTHTQVAIEPISAPGPRVRRISEADLNWALSEGWKDFQAKRGDLIVLALIYPLVGLVAAAAALNQLLLPMFFPLVAGLSLLGPAVASGFYELARRREARLDSSWIHFVDPLRGRSRTSLALLTGGLMVLFVAWLIVALVIYKATLGADHAGATADFLSRLFTTPQGWTMIIVGNLAGFIFAVVALALSFVSFPLVVDKPVDAVTAVSTSIRAVSMNPRVAASWGLRVAALLVLGCLPLFVGLAVVLPVVGYASWHLYTRLVER